ncbi:hypothetical protein CYMTET_50806 [Cymbomonas tetramitiformis]|uniref:Uncharacterized protein n=1 Tax=Cymbomonas tetramitiformis TaxID=36881 RepID=A0AAE0BP09_9CHLO|nr:hypothetical protein CYMTET_50806 [Cymbomonas tetramitiformis]
MFPPIIPRHEQSAEEEKPDQTTVCSLFSPPAALLEEPEPAALIRSPAFFGVHRVGQGDVLRVGKDPVLTLSLEGDTMQGFVGTLCLRAAIDSEQTEEAANSVVWLGKGLRHGTLDSASVQASTTTPQKPSKHKMQAESAEYSMLRDVGPYRYRVVQLDTEGEEVQGELVGELVGSPKSTSPTSNLQQSHKFLNTPAVPDSIRRLGDVHVAVVAVDRPSLPFAGRRPPIPHLEVGESHSVWLTSQRALWQECTVGDMEDFLDLGLHITPLVAPTGSSGPDPKPSIWRAELDVMRMGNRYESHWSMRLDGKRVPKGSLVGDYRIEVKKRAGPMCTFGNRTSSRSPRTITSEYPLLLLHVLVSVTRVSPEEADAHARDHLAMECESEMSEATELES